MDSAYCSRMSAIRAPRAVDVGGQRGLEHRQDVLDERLAAGHPLEVGAVAVVVRPVQARAREAVHEPAEQRLVAGVHPQGDLRLLAVPAEEPCPSSTPATSPWSNVARCVTLGA